MYCYQCKISNCYIGTITVENTINLKLAILVLKLIHTVWQIGGNGSNKIYTNNVISILKSLNFLIYKFGK